jgi:hypothetical protein
MVSLPPSPGRRHLGTIELLSAHNRAGRGTAFSSADADGVDELEPGEG